MKPVRYVPTSASLRFSKQVADSLGLEFDRDDIQANAPFLLSTYFNEVVSVVGNEMQGVPFTNYSFNEVNAFASETSFGLPFVHVDQHFDFWAFGLCVLWTYATLKGVSPTEEKAIDQLVLNGLDQIGGSTNHENFREQLAPFILSSGDTLRVAHDLSIACFVALVCHELAHHRLMHVRSKKRSSPELELEADIEGYRMMRVVFADHGKLSTIPRQPYSLAGFWVILSLVDAAERRAAQRANLNERRKPRSHPLASDRISALMPLFEEDQARSKELETFFEGFDRSWVGFLASTKLLAIG